MKRFPFFEKLKQSNKELLLAHAKEMKIPSDMEIFHQGDRCREIFFLVEGSVRVYRAHESGHDLTLYYLQPLEQCNVNLNSVLTDTPSVGTAVSEGECVGISIPAHITKHLYTDETAYQEYIFSLFALRLESLVYLVEDVRFKKLDIRLKEWLSESGEKTLHITHDKIAAHMGSSREVISRLLKEFEREGLIQISRGQIDLLF
jgi:CRP/FNR family transcriptional regulator